jgi:anti-sigma regulatory factor (Ser/Thr protein kinase)/N-acetylglutamate synthase-like GNAT family acetyltransferase
LWESRRRFVSMHACLSVSSDQRLLSLVSAFGREFAGAAGLPDRESARLVGALDEAVRFVSERAYPGDPAGRIEITLEPAERGIRVSVHDWGRPLTSAEGPAELVDLGAAAEDLRLINLGGRGKRLSFIWRTNHELDVAPGLADAPPPVVADADADEITVRDAQVEDAEPIAQLLYGNYALSYVHPDFYRPRWLREELLTGRVLSSVAVHGTDIVGHHALLLSADAPVAETAVAVVAPAYRGLGVFGRLGQHTLARARARGLQALYGRAVTVHPYSQRAEIAHGYHETALCLALSPGTMTPRAARAPAHGARRTALMISFLPLQRAPRRVSLPQRYRDRLLETYARLGLETRAPVEPAPQGVIGLEREPEAAAAALTIRGWDEGLAAQVTEKVRMLLAEHLDVIYADLDLEATTDPDSAVQALRDLGFSYAGLRLHGPGNHDHLRLQRLNSTDVELDQISTASPPGHELVRFVLEDLKHV